MIGLAFLAIVITHRCTTILEYALLGCLYITKRITFLVFIAT